MEYKGILTGIGDTNKIEKEIDEIINSFILSQSVSIENTVYPENDAEFYDTVIGKNTIIKGLELNGNILSAGACLLCGYRGIIEESIEIENIQQNKYIYGKFTIRLNPKKLDAFEIIATDTKKEGSNVDVRSIPSAGVYYLTLYGDTPEIPSVPIPEPAPDIPDIEEPDIPEQPDTPEQTQLPAPTIALSGDTLQITDTSGKAESFDILVDGVVMASVDNEVEEETYTLSGTWIFSENIEGSTKNSFDIKFTSMGVDFNAIYFWYDDKVQFRNVSTNEFITVYTYERGWLLLENNEAYCTITFDGAQIVSKEFYDWFTANAHPQRITFTIGGTTYQAIDGMTWAEWVSSSYNTGGFIASEEYRVYNDNGSIQYNNSDVKPTDIIIANAIYTLYGMSSG